MQIQTIEEKTGLDRATIRYYEQEGLIFPKRLQNGYRDYSEKNLQDLLKIKLLRQIGLPLESIFQLMEGKDHLKSALENQLIVLKDHKAKIENAETVCKMILQDDVTFETIVPNRYYVLPNNKKCIESKVVDIPYTEFEYAQVHPVRRFFGRYLDQILTSAILMLIFIVILRIRPFGEVQTSLLSIAALFLSMPVNALFLCLLGTTPGKFAVGIFLRSPEGKNPSFVDALRREWAVFRYGMGFNLPVYNIVRLIKSYNIHTDGRELEWDYDCSVNVSYDEWQPKRTVFSVILALASVITIVFASFNAQYPKHRSTELTLAQYAENYNDYAKQFDYITYLSAEGEWYVPEEHKNVISIDEDYYSDHWQFITDEQQRLKQIKIEVISNSSLIFWGGGKNELAILTAVMSQPGTNFVDANQVTQILYELKDTYYDFNGLIVEIEKQEQGYASETPTKLLVNITFP